jgi:hypothetical protein
MRDVATPMAGDLKAGSTSESALAGGLLCPSSSLGRETTMATKSWVLLMGLTGVMTIGCASVVLPGAEVNHFEASMAAATHMGVFKLRADGYQRGAFGMPQAEEHLLLALDQFDLAQTMASKGNPRSRFLLARAQSDADLALCLTREAAVRSRALGLNPYPLQFPSLSSSCEETKLRANILKASARRQGGTGKSKSGVRHKGRQRRLPRLRLHRREQGATGRHRGPYRVGGGDARRREPARASPAFPTQ